MNLLYIILNKITNVTDDMYFIAPTTRVSHNNMYKILQSIHYLSTIVFQFKTTYYYAFNLISYTYNYLSTGLGLRGFV